MKPTRWAVWILVPVAACGPGESVDFDEASVPVAVSSSSSFAPLTTLLAGGEAASPVVLRDPDADLRDATEIPLLFMERACTTGQRADDRFRTETTVSAEELSVRVFVVPPDGDQGCPSNPWTPASIVLDEPLGERRVRGVSEPEDELDWPRQLQSDLGRRSPPGFSWTPTSERLSVVSEVRCEDLGIPIGAEFHTYTDGASFDDLLGGAIEQIGGPLDGFHGWQGVGDSSFFVQFYEGVTVASISIHRMDVGWSAEALRCDGLPDDWQPDLEVPDLEQRGNPAATVLAADVDVDAVRALLDDLDTLTPIGDAWSITANRRCPTMIAVEDALETTGWNIVAYTTVDPEIAAGTQVETTRGQELVVGRSDGRGIRVRLDASNVITVERVEYLIDAWSQSYLSPCFLDRPLVFETIK